MDEPQLSQSELERQARLRVSRVRKVKTASVWFFILAVVAGGIAWLISYARKSEGEKPGVAIADQGNRHIALGDAHEPYNSNPPTSGPHLENPAKWGIYDEPLPDEQLIHNLEHGGIWISYRDANDTELIGKLKDLADDYTLKVILTPRSQNDSAIAVAAWGRFLKLETFDRKQIESFIKAFINKGPEQVPF